MVYARVISAVFTSRYKCCIYMYMTHLYPSPSSQLRHSVMGRLPSAHTHTHTHMHARTNCRWPARLSLLACLPIPLSCSVWTVGVPCLYAL